MSEHGIDERILRALIALGERVERLSDRQRAIELQILRVVKVLENLVLREMLPTALEISQTGETGMIIGVPVGGSGNFQESFVPANAALPAGAVLSVTWTADDPLVTLTPSADGSSVVASVDKTDTAKSFNLTATGTSAALPGPITSGPVPVPILPTPPPLPTALAVNQTP